MTLDALRDRLTGVRRSGAGYTALCPAHDDRRESLTFAAGTQQPIVATCHAGCSFEAIMAAAEKIDPSDVSAQRQNGHRPPVRKKGPPIDIYHYHDEVGTLLYEVCRYDDPKSFSQRRPDGTGGWINNVTGVPRVIFKLNALGDWLAAQGPTHRVVTVVEGEKDVLALWKIQVPATTWAGGAAAIGRDVEAYLDQIAALGITDLRLVPDGDRPGRTAMTTWATAAVARGVTILWCDLVPPDSTDGRDVSDVLAEIGPDALYRRLVEESRPWTPPADASAKPGATDGLGLTPLGELLQEPDETHSWVVAERLPAGGLSVLAGKPKAGKSTLARNLAHAVARGTPWLGFETTQGPVIYLALEEKRAEVRAHFRAMGATAADPIHVLCAAAPTDALARLRKEADRRHPVLIIVDPLFRFVRVRDGNDYATMTTALEPVMTLARETGAHVLLVHHLGKGERSGADAILGSTAILGAVDTALLMRRGETYRTLSSTQRYGEDLDEITLALDPVTRTVTAGRPRVEAERDEIARLILTFMQHAAAPVTEAELDAGIECRAQSRRAALRTLVAKGIVVRIGRGRRADPFRYTRGTYRYAEGRAGPAGRETTA